jgi:HIRAN domain
MDASTVFGVLATLAVVWLFIRPSKSAQREKIRQATGQANRSASSSDAQFHWEPLGTFDFEVVGESNYQGAIGAIAGDHGTESSSAEFTAELVPEDSNEYDSQAVAVRAGGKTLGYLSRQDARSFRRRLAQKNLSNQVTTCAACMVGGGTRRTGERLSYGICLDIKPFE